MLRFFDKQKFFLKVELTLLNKILFEVDKVFPNKGKIKKKDFA